MITTKKQNTLEYLVSSAIAVPHGFTTRFGGVSTGFLASLNLTVGRGDTLEHVEENIRILGRGVGFDPERIVLTRQIHSDLVRVVTEADCLGLCHQVYPQCDGLVTNTPGLSLMVFTADCTPLLLWDPVTGAVGAAHAGWRGTASDIAGKTVRKMQEAFGCNPADIRAAIGPNIGFCHFETGSDVPQAMLASFGSDVEPFLRPAGEKYYVDLKEINRFALNRAGVVSVDISTECTMCSPDRFWSHRVTQGKRGAQGAVIQCKEVRP